MFTAIDFMLIHSLGLHFHRSLSLYSLLLHCHLPCKFLRKVRANLLVFYFFFPMTISKLLLSWINHLSSEDIVQYMPSVLGVSAPDGYINPLAYSLDFLLAICLWIMAFYCWHCSIVHARIEIVIFVLL